MEPTGVDGEAVSETPANLQQPEGGAGHSSRPEVTTRPSVQPVPGGKHTRLSATWTGLVAALIVLIVLIVFIAENTQRSTVVFFGLHGSAPVAVLLLISAVAGALIVVIVGAARLLQLRLAARHTRHARGTVAADRAVGRPATASAPESAGPGADAYPGPNGGMGQPR